MVNKKNIFYKAGVIFSLLLFFTINLQASNNAQKFILNHDNLIDHRTTNKIFQMGSECLAKTKVHVFLYLSKGKEAFTDSAIKKQIMDFKDFQKNLTKDLPKPYVLLSVVLNEKLLDVVSSSKQLSKIVGKNDILDGYIIPLLASHGKNTIKSKLSAGILNGYAQITDNIADSKDITLKSSIGSAGKITGTIWKIFMYILVIGGLVLYIYARFKHRNKKS